MDSLFELVAVLFIAFWVWLAWPSRALTRDFPVRSSSGRWIVVVTLPICVAIVFCVLWFLSDPEVRTSPSLQGFFALFWVLVLFLIHTLSSLLGLSWLEDGVERSNAAAAWAGAGLTFGATFVVAGANIGAGPTELTTLGPMMMGVAGLVALWVIFALSTRSLESVTVERDLPSGLRLASVLVVWGLILGRSVAGDWVSVDATLRDYLWQGIAPCSVLLALAAIVEILERPSRRRPPPDRIKSGIIPAVLFFVLGCAWLWYLGVPS
jgi:hypothetical protein